MSKPASVFPTKCFEVQNALMDSTRWERVRIREDDIVIATYAKAGTTWLQQIVGQILSQGDPTHTVVRQSPWIELRVIPTATYEALDKQPGRRFMKSHLPAGAIPYSPTTKYIYVGRDGRDICWSLHNHYSNFTDEFIKEINAFPGWNGPPHSRGEADVHKFYVNWIENNGAPSWPFWPHIRAWWNVRNVSNVKLLHFNDMKVDLESVIKNVAAFLDVELPSENRAAVLHQCSFEYMKSHAADMAPRGGANWKGGAETFINKGSNGRWKDVLSLEESSVYEATALKELGPECASWLKNGAAAISV
jgi:aryl sulfotransferase